MCMCVYIQGVHQRHHQREEGRGPGDEAGPFQDEEVHRLHVGGIL